MSAIPLFKGEAMLLSWSDSSARGKTVTFALHPAECPDSHPFRGLGTGKSGQRFALVAVPVTDEEGDAVERLVADETAALPAPVEPAPASPVEKERRPFSSLPLSTQIALKCQDRAFQAWIMGIEGMEICDKEAAAGWVRAQCHVESRREITPGSEAATLWSKILTDFERDTNRMAEIRS